MVGQQKYTHQLSKLSKLLKLSTGSLGLDTVQKAIGVTSDLEFIDFLTSVQLEGLRIDWDGRQVLFIQESLTNEIDELLASYSDDQSMKGGLETHSTHSQTTILPEGVTTSARPPKGRSRNITDQVRYLSEKLGKTFHWDDKWQMYISNDKVVGVYDLLKTPELVKQFEPNVEVRKVEERPENLSILSTPPISSSMVSTDLFHTTQQLDPKPTFFLSKQSTEQRPLPIIARQGSFGLFIAPLTYR